MTEQAPPLEPLATLQAVLTELEGTRKEIVKLRTYGRRNRKFILIDIVITLVLTVLGGGVVHAIQAAGQANSAQLALCQAGNTARAQQVELWEFLIHISQPPKTAQGRKVLATFEHHLHVVFASRDCESLGRK